jgi:Pentapeptide repeats (9 copies)/Ion channel
VFRVRRTTTPVRLIHSDHGLTEGDSGDQPPASRLRRGANRSPSWRDVTRWRYRWTPDKVAQVLYLLSQHAPVEQFEVKTGFAPLRVPRVDGSVEDLLPDLRGLDVTVFPPESRAYWRTTNQLAGVDLSHAQLAGARLTGLNMSQVKAPRADFRKATLRSVDFSQADLTKANFEDADLRNALFDQALVGFVKYSEDGWLDRGTVIMHEAQLQRAVYVDPLLERYAKDQAYLYVLRYRNRNNWPKRRLIFLWWLTSNYGQSLTLWTLWSAIVIGLFAVAYSPPPTSITAWHRLIERHGISLHVGGQLSRDWPTPLYFSISTFMTLGLGDVTPTNPVGELFVSAEVILGYFMFGVLLSILSNKVARRA